MVKIELEYTGKEINKNYLNILNYLENEDSGFEYEKIDLSSKYTFNSKLKTSKNKNNLGLEIIIGEPLDNILIETNKNKPISMSIPIYQECIKNNYKLKSKL